MRKLLSASLFVLALAVSTPMTVAQAPMPMGPAQTTYVASAQIDVMKLLPPPPALQSEEQKRDLDKLLAIQKARTPADEQRALADATSGTFGFADVLGPKFTAAAAPKLALLMEKVRGDGAAVENVGKDNWKRARPFETSKDIRAVGDLPKGHSYPKRQFDRRLPDRNRARQHGTREERCAVRARARSRRQPSRAWRALSDRCRSRTAPGDCNCNGPVSEFDIPRGFHRGESRAAACTGAVSDFFGAGGFAEPAWRELVAGTAFVPAASTAARLER